MMDPQKRESLIDIIIGVGGAAVTILLMVGLLYLLLSGEV